MEKDTIDALLERYLGLVDQYTKLRAELTGLQAGVYQDLARANFSAERGIRYGQDFYDDRMQSLRRLSIIQDGGDEDNGSYPRFEVVPRISKDASEGEHEGDDKSDVEPESKVVKDDDEEGEKKDASEATVTQKPGDPLRWFGLLTPMPLRQAQGRAVRAVEEIIPKLASVDAEMSAVEIRVRRARKRRAKAEAAAEKEMRSSS